MTGEGVKAAEGMSDSELGLDAFDRHARN